MYTRKRTMYDNACEKIKIAIADKRKPSIETIVKRKDSLYGLDYIGPYKPNNVESRYLNELSDQTNKLCRLVLNDESPGYMSRLRLHIRNWLQFPYQANPLSEQQRSVVIKILSDRGIDCT